MTALDSVTPSFRLALVAALAFAASGCGGGGPFGSPEAVGHVLDAVTAAAPEARSFLARDADDAGTGAVEVFVDLSLSMQPYLADLQGSVLRRVLVGLSNDLGGDVAFRGFGFEPDSTGQTVSPVSVGALLTAAPYVRVNNDYGDLFDRFVPRKADAADSLGALRVVFTDGVESDPEGGAMFGRVVGAADRYVRAGGTFAVLVWRAPYSGRYYSEGAACPRGAFAMACPDRPLVAFVFAPTAGQLDALTASLADADKPAHTIRVGARDGHIEAVAEVPGENPKRASVLLRKTATVVAAGYEPVTTALVSEQHALPSGHVPLTFRLTVDARQEPWRALSTEGRAAFLASLRPRLRGWAVSGRDSTVLTEFEPDVFRPTVETDSTGALVVTVPVKRPAVEGRHVAWLLSLAPYQTAQRLVPADLSTPTDCSAEACSQTLNLAPLLGAILRDDYVPARAVLLTEWR